MAFTKFDDIINARANGNLQDLFQANTATLGGVSGAWYYGAHTAGIVNGGGITHANIPAGQITNAATPGAVPLVAAGGSNKKYLLSAGVTTPNVAGFTLAMLVDYLWEGGNVLQTLNTLQTVASPTLTRYEGNAAAGNMILMESAVTAGATAQSVVVGYTNQAGVAGRLSQSTAMVASVAAGRVAGNASGASPFLTLQAGDSGVQSIQSVQFSAANTVGTCHLCIVRPLMVIPFIAANSWSERDVTTQLDNLIELVKGSDSQHGCLEWLFLTGGTTATTFGGLLRTAEG